MPNRRKRVSPLSTYPREINAKKEYTYHNSPRPPIIIHNLIDSEIGIRDLIPQKIRTLRLGVVLPHNIVVLGCGLVLVFLRGLHEIGDPFALHYGVSTSDI